MGRKINITFYLATEQALNKTNHLKSICIGTDDKKYSDSTTSTEINTTNSCVGPDIVAYADQSSYVNWLGENSRARRTQTSTVTTDAVTVQTDDGVQNVITHTIGTDPIQEIIEDNIKAEGEDECSSPPLSLPENLTKSFQSLNSDRTAEFTEDIKHKAEPREFDP